MVQYSVANALRPLIQPPCHRPFFSLARVSGSMGIPARTLRVLRWSPVALKWVPPNSWPCIVDLGKLPIGCMYGIYANIGGILMVNVTILTIHGSCGLCNIRWLNNWIWIPDATFCLSRFGRVAVVNQHGQPGNVCTWNNLAPKFDQMSSGC